MYYDRDSKEQVILGDTSQILPVNYLEHSLREEFNGRVLSKLGVFTALEAPLAKGGPKFATAIPFNYLDYDNSFPMTAYASICMIASAPGHDINRTWRKQNMDYEYK